MRFCVPGIELKNPSSLEIREKYEKTYEISHPGSGPENTKKIRENTRKWPKNDNFRIFYIFFSSFRGPTRVGNFVSFSYFFRISWLEGFLSSTPGTQNRKRGRPKWAGAEIGQEQTAPKEQN